MTEDFPRYKALLCIQGPAPLPAAKVVNDLIKRGLVKRSGERVYLTERGQEELKRLSEIYRNPGPLSVMI